jgi:hypothetical protein
MIEFLFLPLIICLWYLGGQGKKPLRVVAVPILMGLLVAFLLPLDLLHKFIAFMLTAGGLQGIRIGYGNYDPENDPKPSFLARLLKDRGGWWLRAVWGLLVAFLGLSGLVLGRYVSPKSYFYYIPVNVIVNFFVSRLHFPVFLADSCVAIAVWSMILIV